MPIPLFFIAAGALSGLFGVGKSIKAGMDQSEAEETNNRAQSMIEEAANKKKKLQIKLRFVEKIVMTHLKV